MGVIFPESLLTLVASTYTLNPFAYRPTFTQCVGSIKNVKYVVFRHYAILLQKVKSLNVSTRKIVSVITRPSRSL